MGKTDENTMAAGNEQNAAGGLHGAPEGPEGGCLWKADLGNGIYRNPILHADYSDPDVIRAGEVYYMTASSFNYTPGLPILRSEDLVNWELVNYAVKNIGYPAYALPQHSKGIWAPAMRFHEGWFYIYYGMPDEGIFMVKTKDPLGEWEPPVLVLAGKGLIDSCPFWDDDGRAYMIHAYAKSRIGFKSFLGIFEMSSDGSRAISEDHLLFDGTETQITIEGPKVYKRNGWYYIFAPAGGVKEGWQTVLRSRDIHGPYEERIVMRQGDTPVNGPHQGGLVDTPEGEEWFVHFQDRGAYGRVVHLQPVAWRDGWPVIGWEKEGREWGEPCLFHKKPLLPEKKPVFLKSSDDFSKETLGLQWQWMGDHREDFYSLKARPGFLRLYSKNPSGQEPVILWNCANVLTQKLLCPEFQMDVRMEYPALETGEQAGVIVTGGGYAWLGVVRKAEGTFLNYVHAGVHAGASGKEMRETVLESLPLGRRNGTAEQVLDGMRPQKENATLPQADAGAIRTQVDAGVTPAVPDGEEPESIRLRVNIRNGEQVTAEFAWSLDGKEYRSLPEPFVLSPHTWVGAKTGLFAVAADCLEHKGYADFARAEYRNTGKEPEPEFQVFEAGELETARHMVEYSAKTSMNIRDEKNRTPLHYAVSSGNLELVRYLVERVGLSPLEGDRELLTPYELAHAKGFSHMEEYFAGVCGACLADMYKNPIRTGMYPDPSIIRVGEDYYMVNSSFVYFPAIPVSHSRDLIHWKIVGYAIEREDWAALGGLEGGRGYWAPDISTSGGRYYITATYRMNDGGTVLRRQMIVSSDRPEGPYGEPVWIDEDGIDPSLFHDDDGRHYMLLNRGARILELNEDLTEAVSPARLLYYGDCKRAPEGPHLLKKDGWYYLFLAEGGTGIGHRITVARSRSLEEPFQPCPYNPIMRQKDPNALIQRCGHGKPVSTPDGRWYMVYLCGRMTDGEHTLLGRETALDPITWTADGWPLVNDLKGPGVLQKKPFPNLDGRTEGTGLSGAADETETPEEWSEDFTGGAPSLEWVSPRGRRDGEIRVTENGLWMKGDSFDLDSLQARNILLRRQTAETFTAQVRLRMEPGGAGEAGLVCYYDENTWLKFGLCEKKGDRSLFLEENRGRSIRRREFGSIPQKESIWLEVETDGLKRSFAVYGPDSESSDTKLPGIRPSHSPEPGMRRNVLAVLTDVDYLCDEGCRIGKRFTGPMAGVFAHGEGCGAQFSRFRMKNGCPDG